MKKIILGIMGSVALSIISLAINADPICPEPSSRKLNYLPVSVINEYCYTEKIKHVLSGGIPVFATINVNKNDFNITGVESGVFFQCNSRASRWFKT